VTSRAPATVSSVLAATEVVCGAVDVLDSRYEDYLFTLPDVIADNASAVDSYSAPTNWRRTPSMTFGCWAVLCG
jgi:2-keto-4-pentenoate hydratase